MTYAELADRTRDPALRALEHAVEGLREQFENANQRADHAELCADLLQVKFEAGALAERIAREEAARLRAELDARRTWDLHRRLRWAWGGGGDGVIHRSRMTEQPRPMLRVIEGGRAQLIADIEFVAAELRELERQLASAREDLRRLLASLGPIS